MATTRRRWMTFRSIYSLFLMALLFLNGGSAPTASALETGKIEISPQETKQHVQVMGGDMERSAESLLDAADPLEIAGWAFQDIPFNVCRVQYDKHQEKEEGRKRFDFYDKQIVAMKLVEEINPKIEFFATQRSDYNGYKLDDGNNFPPWIYDPETNEFDADKHGIFLADFVIHMYRQGVPIRYLSSGKEITQILDAPLAIQAIKSMNRQLDGADVPRPLMVEPCAWSLPQAIEFIEQVERAGAENLFHAYSTHNYRHHSESEWRKFVEAATRAGAQAWNGEAGMDHVDNGIAEPPFERNVNSMVKRFRQFRAGIHGEIFFELWSRGRGRETRPIYFQRGQVGTRMRAYYLVRHWTKTVNGSTVVDSTVDASPSIDALAFRKDKEIFLWMANLDSCTPTRLKLSIRNSRVVLEPLEYLLWSRQTPIEGSKRSIDCKIAMDSGVDIPPHSLLALKLRIE